MNLEMLKKLKRFIHEVNIVERYQSHIKGIVPIIHKNIPEELNGDFKYADVKGLIVWYVMEFAIPIEEKLGNCDEIENIIDCIISLSETLAELHTNEIVHRDIKPSNLYFHQESWAFGDFGLVAYPEFSGLTEEGDRIGNYATIAPEMRYTDINERDARPADVWSLAKTLWMLLTNNWNDCFEGVYSPNDEKMSISKYIPNIPIKPLEDILSKAICYEPQKRIDINEFLRLVRDYKVLLNEKKKIKKY